MSDPVSLAALFDAAEQAAQGGDFAAASRLLGEAARAQEAALGADHLDLANTLNNLAVAHERCGQLDDAEREYRRAHAIAARALPADDALVTTSAQNLREFCEAHGRPIDGVRSALTLADVGPEPMTVPARPSRPVPPDAPTVPIEPLAMTFAGESVSAPRGQDAPRSVSPAPASPTRDPARRDPARPDSARPGPTPPAAARPDQPRPAATPVVAPPAADRRPAPAPAAVRPTPSPAPEAAAPARRMSIPILVALGVIAALVIWALAGRRAAVPPADTPPADARVAAPSSAAAPAPNSAAASRPAPAAPKAGAARGPAAVAATVDGLTVGDAQLCTSLSASYRCDAAGSTVRPGRLVFYTRLVATRNTSVVHRWYRGNEVRQSVRLEVPARRQGFRTFSRTTVAASDSEWRVELRSADGKILHTEKFTVR